MKRFSYLFSFAAIIAASLFSLQSCQKEAVNVVNPVKPGMTGEDRSPSGIIYGVTLYDGVNPCEIIGIDQNTGAIVSHVTAFYVDFGNVTHQLDNLTGICFTNLSDAHFLTTGSTGNSSYNESLFKVNPITGECSFASTSTVNTVSDLEYEPNTNTFYGLQANTNRLVTITDNNNNYSNYAVGNISGIAAGYSLKGLSLVIINKQNRLVGCATSANAADPAQLYLIQPGALNATATIMTNLAPVADLSAGHCAIGWDRDINQMSINRSGFGGFGLNGLPWVNPLPNNANTFFWGAANNNFEDLTSSVY